MNGNDAGRTLAKIESDLREAEEAFAEADARLEEAKSERSTALGKINKHQLEIDCAIAELRQRSVAGSKWSIAKEKTEGDLVLQEDDIVDDKPNSNDSKLNSAATANTVLTHIEHLRSHTHSQDSDPVLKIANPKRRASGFEPS